MAGARNTINVPVAGSPRFERDTVLAISRLKASMMSPSSAPTFAGITLTDLTASRLVATDADKALASSDLVNWVTGTTNRVTVADDGDGTITLSGPQDLHAAGSPTFADLTLSSPSNIYSLDHDSFSGFVADEHVAHSGVSISAGTGLSGGGDISASRTLSLSHLGLQDLSDPGGDRVFFWDDSETKADWLSLGNSLAITTTTLDTIQDIRTAASPSFAGLTITDGTRPFTVTPGSGEVVITGTASDLSLSPNLKFKFSSDADACMSYLNYTHDNCAFIFDAYHNGTTWVSSDAGSNFSIYKTNDKLRIGYNSGTAKGSTFAAFTWAAYFDANGNFGVGAVPSEQVHASDTIRADTAFNLNGTDGLSGTLTLDDGANWRITLTFSGGILTGQTTGASSAATASWA